jgi:hypothetical protein
MLIKNLFILDTKLLSSELLQNLKDELLGLIRTFVALLFFENHLMDTKVAIEVVDVLFLGTPSTEFLLLVDLFEFCHHLCVHFHLIDLSLDDSVQLQRI